MSEEESITSHAMMKLLLDPAQEHYRGIEGALSVMVVALVAKGGVESVVESMVSVMEAHSSPLRGLLDQERIENEMMVAWNGEDLYHCDSIVKDALQSYLSDFKRDGDKGGHFVRQSSNVKRYLVSKSVDTKQMCLQKLPAMSQQKLFNHKYMYQNRVRIYANVKRLNKTHE